MDDITAYLRSYKFIGPFPHNVDVLLVSFDTAWAEAKTVRPELTKQQLKTILKKDKIFIFNSLEDWVAFKTPEK